MRRALPLLALLGCAAEEDATEVEREVLAFRTLAFAEADGVNSVGFDLDGEVSAAGGAGGCGIADYVHPDGTPGIDNSFAPLLPALDLVGGDALPELVQAAVTSGELLLLAELTPQDDGCEALEVLRGDGAPLLGSDGLILPGQTFDLDPDAPSSRVQCASADADLVSASDLGVRLPLAVFDEWIDLGLTDGRLQLERTSDETWSGVIAGAVSAQEIKDNVATFDGIPSELHALIQTTMDVRADLRDADGACSLISVVLEIEAVNAFIYDDARRP